MLSVGRLVSLSWNPVSNLHTSISLYESLLLLRRHLLCLTAVYQPLVKTFTIINIGVVGKCRLLVSWLLVLLLDMLMGDEGVNLTI